MPCQRKVPLDALLDGSANRGECNAQDENMLRGSMEVYSRLVIGEAQQQYEQ
jgi:hypothetical protein